MEKFKELEKYAELNPIRDHIALMFKCVEEGDELSYILNDIENEFTADISRVIVFCFSRKKTEESAKICNEKFSKHSEFKSKAAYYHAGMDSESRHRAFQRYKDGSIQILFSTKAFGMGMDIPNIHHVYHLDPSSSFEDYLQEVGRAGRNADSLTKAGFSSENPIKAICVYNKDSFAKKIDWIQKTQASWNDMCNAYEIYKDFRRKFISDDNSKKALEYFPVPYGILGVSNKYQASDMDLGSLYRLSLYWLEKSERINSRYNVPAYLEFNNTDNLNKEIVESIPDDVERSIVEYVLSVKKKSFENEESTLVEGNQLMKAAGILDRDSLFSKILSIQEKGYLELINKINIDLTDSGISELSRVKYLAKITDYRPSYQFLQALRLLGNRIIDGVSPFEENEFDLDYLNLLAKEIQTDVFIDQFLQSANIKEDYLDGVKNYLSIEYVKDLSKQDKKIKSNIRKDDPELFEILRYQRYIVREDRFANKLKTIFQLLSSHNEVNITSKFSENKEEIVQSINITDKRGQIKEFIKDLVSDASNLFEVLSTWSSRVVDVNKLILELNISDRSYRYIELLLLCLKKMGYIKVFGSLIPMAIEMKFMNLTPLNDLPEDLSVKNDYIETIRLKKLRLCVLNGFCDVKEKNVQTEYILEYFKSATSPEVINLIEERSSRSDEILSSYRADALEKLIEGDGENEGLNTEQKAVYNSDIRSNLSVIAGPGTGKTHTLVLRVARLIQVESISPSNILVLAYNRSVAEELKIRLKDLFSQLGYKSLINSLQIFTFHGLMGAVLKQNGKDIELSLWEDEFIKLFKVKGRRCLNNFESIQYAFIDEFQDITKKRLEILNYVAPKDRVYITAIGDPNQSIYGYERSGQGGTRSPLPFYEEFNSIYNPGIKHLSTNYRSSPEIINTSNDVLGDQLGTLKINPKKDVKPGFVKVLQEEESWLEPLISLLKNEDIGETAVMFRSNEELYGQYYKLRRVCEKLGIGIELKGSTNQFARTREIAAIQEVLLRRVAGEEISKELIINEVIKPIKANLPNWDEELISNFQLLFDYFYDQYGSNSTYADFFQFVNEVTRRDDGQLFSLLKSKKNNASRKLILTTVHRVKGLEFDAVVVPASFAKLPFDGGNRYLSDEGYLDIIEEEKRLLYVAYSRAKHHLVIQNGKREQAIKNYTKFNSAEYDTRLGIPVKNEFGQVSLSWKATENRFKAIQTSLHSDVIIGSEVIIKKNSNGKFILCYGNQEIEMFSGRFGLKFTESFYGGIYIDSIIRYNLKQSLEYDEKNNKNYTNYWCEKAKSQGYIYTVNFYGFAIELEEWKNKKIEIDAFVDSVINNTNDLERDQKDKYSNSGNRWSEEELMKLRESYTNGLNVNQCSEMLKRKPGGIASKLKSEGLLKDDYWIKELEKYDNRDS